MSAIGGMLRFDGSPVSSRDLERMANTLQPYGPDKSAVLIGERWGLAHVLMRTTPEDKFDRQPYVGPSGAIIVADLRLDNRDDLAERLGLSQHQVLGWPDSRLALSAWEKFGSDCWPMLHGPFAIAIWDPRKQVLLLARDRSGTASLLYYRNDRFFCFASMPKGLFALPDVPRVLNHQKMADFLVLNHSDHKTSFYREVVRVQPAQLLTVDAGGGMTERCYWSFADIRPIRLASDQDYADGLRDCLDRAVRRQMRSSHPVGCYLSGGLDSSSVTMLAARALRERNSRLAAFTQVPRPGFAGRVPGSRYADETPFVEEISRKAGNIDVTYVRNDEVDDFADLERMFVLSETPIRNPTNVGWMLRIPRLARAQGIRVLLEGSLGNATISWSGWSQAAGHLRNGRLLTALRQWSLFYRLTRYSRFVSFRKLLLEPVLSESVIDAGYRLRHRGKAPYLDYSPIRADHASRMNVSFRAQEAGHSFHGRLQIDDRLRWLKSGDYLAEWRAGEKALHGVETRDPTADPEVVNFCLGVPPEQFLAEDIDRSLIRRAMWGVSPDSVLTNRLVGFQSADWYEKFEPRKQAFLDYLIAQQGSPSVACAIDLERLQRIIRKWPQDDRQKQAEALKNHLPLTRGLAAARFLNWIDSENGVGPN